MPGRLTLSSAGVPFPAWEDKGFTYDGEVDTEHPFGSRATDVLNQMRIFISRNPSTTRVPQNTKLIGYSGLNGDKEVEVVVVNHSEEPFTYGACYDALVGLCDGLFRRELLNTCPVHIAIWRGSDAEIAVAVEYVVPGGDEIWIDHMAQLSFHGKIWPLRPLPNTNIYSSLAMILARGQGIPADAKVENEVYLGSVGDTQITFRFKPSPGSDSSLPFGWGDFRNFVNAVKTYYLTYGTYCQVYGEMLWNGQSVGSLQIKNSRFTSSIAENSTAVQFETPIQVS